MTEGLILFKEVEHTRDALEELASTLIFHGFKIRIDQYAETFIDNPVLELRISPRPTYCDRGQWLWHAYSRDLDVAYVDDDDGFPRYYYSTRNMVSEISLVVEPSHE